MLFIYGTNLSALDKSSLKKILGHAGISEERLCFVDTAYEDLNVGRGKCFLGVGKQAVRLLARALIEEGCFKTTDFFGNDLLDVNSGFFFYNVGLEVTEIMASQENKDVIWDKAQQIAKYYLDWYPFDDPLPEFKPEPKLEPEPEIKVEAPVQPEVVTSVVEQEVIVVKAQTVQSVTSVEFSTLEMLNALYAHVTVTDPGLGKSLAKYEKFTLETSTGILTVFPTTRIPEDVENSFSFKDLIILLRSAVFLKSDTITMEKANGTSVG
jgi:hypothetical protein